MTTLGEQLPPPGSDPLDVVTAFMAWAESSGRPLYPHQEDALMALAEEQHVVLATPTGCGKSMAALAGIALARNRGERSVWTAPIKALVAEKFFDLAALFGAETVGLATGDASINPDATVLVCTAEVYANQALGAGAIRPGEGAFGFACLDEFHYYGERDRGWAWQVPLLTAHHTQFLLMSATLGDMTTIVEDLRARTGRPVAQVTSVTRPTPLYHAWRMTSVADSVTEAVKDGLSPVYVVHTTQAAAGERANALNSLPLTTRPQREAIAEALKEVRFTKGYGQTLQRVLRNGVGIHHAGMLPKYRRLVERLAGEGLLPVICGTDTLGVGVNIPIRTVLLTSMTKFDGHRVRLFTAREFHQLAGRAGRTGFDPDGHVWAQAPDHVIENAKALSRAGDDPKARRKATKSQPPKGFVHYDEQSFERLVAASPEPLVSRFKVSADLIATVLARPDGPAALKELLATNHEPENRRRLHKRRAISVFRSLEEAGVAERRRDADGRCAGVEVGSLVDGSDERSALRFSSPLVPFALEVLSTLDRDDPSYHLDLVSVVESVLDDPMPILFAQRDAAKSAEIARMKADGIEYEERMNRLDQVTWPRPLAELVEPCFATYRRRHPWIERDPSPKSILRELLESGETFGGFVHRYQLQRSEGLVLRYLTDAWRTLDRSLTDELYTEELEDVIDWLGTLIRATDASLLDEWERLAGGPEHGHVEREDPGSFGPPKAWRTAVRTAAFGWVELLAQKAHAELAARTGWPQFRFDQQMAEFRRQHESIATDGDARSTRWFSLTETPERWTVRQQLPDNDGDGDWSFTAEVEVAEAIADGAPTLRLVSFGEFGEEVGATDGA
ncbi:MAG: DUF3516 domain-containing protein [Ilumatobacteraceae bacterium]